MDNLNRYMVITERPIYPSALYKDEDVETWTPALNWRDIGTAQYRRQGPVQEKGRKRVLSDVILEVR